MLTSIAHVTDVAAAAQEVQRCEAVSAHASTKEAVQQREQAHQAALMPRVFDGLRSLFGNQGPCAKPMAEASPSHHMQICQCYGPVPASAGEYAPGLWTRLPRSLESASCLVRPASTMQDHRWWRPLAQEACCMTSAMQVVEALSKARGHAMAAADMEAQLRALQGAIPEYLTIQPGRQGPGLSIRVNRRADIGSLPDQAPDRLCLTPLDTLGTLSNLIAVPSLTGRQAEALLASGWKNKQARPHHDVIADSACRWRLKSAVHSLHFC